MPLPTSEQLSKLSAEQLLGLWKLVREFRIKLAAAEGAGLMPASAVKAMTDVVDDEMMQAIVKEQRPGLSAPSGLIPDDPREPAVVGGTGWQKPVELGVPPGIKYVDQLCDVQDALDKAELKRRLGG
jgi:hypothetical protein